MNNDRCALCGQYTHPKDCGVADCDMPELRRTPNLRFTLCELCHEQLRGLFASRPGVQDAREGPSLAAGSTIPPSPALPHAPGGLESSSEAPGRSGEMSAPPDVAYIVAQAPLLSDVALDGLIGALRAERVRRGMEPAVPEVRPGSLEALSSGELVELVRAAKHELHRRSMKRAGEYYSAT